MFDRPNEAGLWYLDENRFAYVHQFSDGLACEAWKIGYSVTLGKKPIGQLPTGNWRKLTAEPAAAKGEGLVELIAACEELLPHISTPGVGGGRMQQLSDKGHRFAWLAELRPLRDRLEAALINLPESELPPASPEVIEGKGQATDPQQRGWYWQEFRGEVSLVHKVTWFLDGARYMKAELPTFPPREPFTAPRRPELVLVRNKSNAALSWIAKSEGAILGNVDVIDETTGEPIKE